MNRVEFIKELSNHLAYEVRPSEVHRLIEYYDEMILDLMEDGYSERAAVKKLGDPISIMGQFGTRSISYTFKYRYRYLVYSLYRSLFSRRNDHWWCRCGFH